MHLCKYLYQQQQALRTLNTCPAEIVHIALWFYIQRQYKIGLSEKNYLKKKEEEESVGVKNS